MNAPQDRRTNQKIELEKEVVKEAYESEILRLQYTAEFRAVRDIALKIKDH